MFERNPNSYALKIHPEGIWGLPQIGRVSHHILKHTLLYLKGKIKFVIFFGGTFFSNGFPRERMVSYAPRAESSPSLRPSTTPLQARLSTLDFINSSISETVLAQSILRWDSFLFCIVFFLIFILPHCLFPEIQQNTYFLKKLIIVCRCQ